MGVFNKIFGRRDKTNEVSGNEQTTNNVGVVKEQKNTPLEQLMEDTELRSRIYEGSMEALEGLERFMGEREWKKEWIEGYDTPQEKALKDIMLELKKSERFDEWQVDFLFDMYYNEEEDRLEIPPEWKEFYDNHCKISSVYSKLQQMLNECKQRRIQLHITTDPEPNERKPDKFGNPTELTPREFAAQQIEKLTREGLIEPEIAKECNIHLRDDDEYDEAIELVEDAI